MSSWSRPSLEIVRPNRGFGNIYRTAEGERDGRTIGGVPLQSATDAVVAAVQLGYKVADKQIERGRKIGKRLRGATNRAGVDGVQALDATERLLMKALLTGLDWIEGAGADSEHPIRRVLAAEYKIFGSLFGLSGLGKASVGADSGGRSQEAVAPAVSSAADAPVTALLIRNKPTSEKRAVIVRSYVVDTVERPLSCDVKFFAAVTSSKTFAGTMTLGTQGDELSVLTTADLPGGLWRAAICANDVQIGYIDVEL